MNTAPVGYGRTTGQLSGDTVDDWTTPPGAILDMSQTANGGWSWYMGETGGINEISFSIDFSVDGENWEISQGGSGMVGPGLNVFNTQNSVGVRFVRIQLQSTVAGSPGTYLVMGYQC